MSGCESFFSGARFLPAQQHTCSQQAPGSASGEKNTNTEILLEASPKGVTVRTGDDPAQYLADPILPAHPFEAGSSQDDGGKVLLLVQLLQTRVQVATLGDGGSGKTLRDNYSGL